MLGGGFIGQMHETNKQNRDILKKNKRKPFEKQDYLSNSSAPLIDSMKLSEEERVLLITKIKRENRRENRIHLLIVIASILILCFLLYLFGPMLKEKTIRFLD